MKRFLLMIMVVFLLLATIVSPVNAVFAETVEPYTAKAMYLVDFNTGEILFEKNADDKLPVASIVKLMTILLTIEQIESEKLNISDEVVFTGVTDESGKIFINELEYGKYYILEKEAPEGYLLNTEKMYFEIKTNGEIVKAHLLKNQF